MNAFHPADKINMTSDFWKRLSLLAVISCASCLALKEVLKIYWRGVARSKTTSFTSPTELVKKSVDAVCAAGKNVRVSRQFILRLVKDMEPADLSEVTSLSGFDKSIHFVEGTWRTVQYFLVVDCLNFCFWPCVLLV
jgi:hypothetical protein